MGDAARILEYTVILHRDAELSSYWVEVPALPGCVSQGKSKQEALRNVKEAIELHLESLREDGEAIPKEDSYRIAVQT